MYSFIVIALVLIGVLTTSFKPILESLNLGLDLQGGFEIVYEVSPLNESEELTDEMLIQTHRALLKRVDVLGVSEPNIEIEGSNRIRVQIAGIQDQNEARKVLSQVVNLSFRNADDELLARADILNDNAAKLSSDQFGNPAVALSIDDLDTFYSITDRVSNESPNMMVIWLDFEEGDSYYDERSKEEPKYISAATVSQAFASDVIIQGNFSKEEAQLLADLINSGSLPTQVNEIYSTSVGANLGESALQQTALAGLVGILLVMLFMTFRYRIAGLVSSLSLLAYSFLVFLLFYLIGGVLTLPGIAAMVLGVGMAVDANVITFERLKEELLTGRSLSKSFEIGNKRSFMTILDANITTFLVAVILYIFGQSSVKGFATMLMISILITLIVTVFFTRFLLGLVVKSGVYDNKLKRFIGVNESKIPNLNKGENPQPHRFANVDFVSKRSTFFRASLGIIVVGVIMMVISGFNLGIDFTAGTKVTYESQSVLSEEVIYEDFSDYGFEVKDYTLINGSKGASVRLDRELNQDEVQGLIDAIEDEYGITPNVDVVTPIIGEELAYNAFLSMLIASIGIIIYVTFRFQSSFGFASIVALLHDAFIVLAIFSIFRLEISKEFIAAILAILGYSINDTIVAFDRIRENIKNVYDNEVGTIEELEHVVNLSLQQTFVRSLMTTITSLLPVVMLMTIGSHSVFHFNIALFVGLIAGTYSSIFIAAQVWLHIKKRNIDKPLHERKKWFDLDDDDEISEVQIKGIND
jgi:SecD/SecF fusion protein